MQQINMHDGEIESFLDMIFAGGLSDKIAELIAEAVKEELMRRKALDVEGVGKLDEIRKVLNSIEDSVGELTEELDSASQNLIDLESFVGDASGNVRDATRVGDSISASAREAKELLDGDESG